MPADNSVVSSQGQRHAIVIGAGLAGAAVCVQLARRGWHLDLIEAHSEPAKAASALPVGMLSPHVTRSPTPLSRLSVLGVELVRRELQTLVPQGEGWQDCEVDNHGADAGRWPAALVRPSALVAAWLAEARQKTPIAHHWSRSVKQLKQVPAGTGRPVWQVLDRDDQVVSQSPVVVMASALGTLDLMIRSCPGLDHDVLPLRPVKGQLSLSALAGNPLSPRPQRNQGVFVPCYEDQGLSPGWPARIWAMGSTYERGIDNRTVTEEAHLRNGRSLDQLNPTAAQRLEADRAAGRLLGWSEVRCASLDRLPLVGALPDHGAWIRTCNPVKQRPPPISAVPRLDGLHTVCALGSRGLSLAALCARTLARQLTGEPDDLDEDLVEALDPARFIWRQARRRPPVCG